LKFLRTQPILRQAAVAVALLLLPVVLAALWSGSRLRLERADEVEAEAGRIATTATALLDEYFASLDAMASLLVRHPAIVTMDASTVAPVFRTLLSEQPLLNNVVLRDSNAHLVITTAGGSADSPPAAVVLQVLATGRPAVSQVEVGPVTRRPIVLLAYPVPAATGSGGLGGVLAISLNLERLERLFANLSLPSGSIVTLVDRNGRVMARSQDSARFIGAQFGPPREPKDVPRTLLQKEVDGVERFHGNAVIERGPWLLSVAIPRSEVLARVAPTYRRNMAFVSVSFMVLVVLGAWLARRFASDLTQLRNAAARIAGGDLSPPAVSLSPNLELAEVQDAFAHMARRLRDTRDALDRQFEQERKMREMLQSLQRQVVRQERLTAVGLLVSGVAHELNNPLQAILGTVELLERRQDLTPEALAEIAFVKTQSGRAHEIIRNLSRFSSQQPGPESAVDLREVIAEVVQLRQADLAKVSIALETELSSVRKVNANFTELEQVTLNFVINAQQAIESAEGTPGRIRIRLTDSGRKVRLEVADNGPGVRPDDEPKLFQPFFTTKPVGKGTGLGLSVSYGIIDSYGGAIGYLRNEWGGATFFFELIAADSPPAGSNAKGQTTNDRAPVLRGSILP
jgi:C4-dicarboxylate-specific signal transduction histidine kinase